jgi:hypothetical protein
VLPQQWIAAFGGIEKMRADQPVHDEYACGEHDRGHREQNHECGHERRPAEQRDAVEGHSRRAQLEDGGDDADRGGNRRDFGEGDRLGIEVAAFARRVFRAGEWHVGKPAVIRTHIQQQREEDHQTAEQEEPIGEGSKAREGNLAAADHQRHEINRRGLHDRDGEKKHHHRPVHGEKLVVEIGADQVVIGDCELQPHQHREQTGADEKAQGSEHESPTGCLVADGAEPSDEAFALAPSRPQELDLLQASITAAHEFIAHCSVSR